MNTKFLLMVFLLLFFSKQEAFGQFDFSHEIGVIAGPVVFYSDFGQRKNFETNSNNVGYGVGIVHYLNFVYSNDFNIYNRYSYFNDHFKIRTEINYQQTELEHYGRWVSPDKTSLFADQLRAMRGSVLVVEIGAQLEYYPMSIRDFQANGNRWMPFLGLGMHYVYFNPEVSSTMGGLNTPITTPDKYYNSFQKNAGSTAALVGGVGLRYKLSKFTDLMLEGRWQYYFSDYVDGLNPTEENNGMRPVPENKSNDWIYWLTVGYIYYIN
ncbi:THC0290_0291 family protein [Aequorivita marina]|uniref:THC0290_0291 family protein n=1 Tax=Aequorivita marina TaxID=3073654 RepID=UPI0028763A43|nr:glutamate dehydrogenase [Aequorivita sp. S2608]MDS1298867.1 glutamate dehydrogenase [Aequorivita sp. S2608]